MNLHLQELHDLGRTRRACRLLEFKFLIHELGPPNRINESPFITSFPRPSFQKDGGNERCIQSLRPNGCEVRMETGFAISHIFRTTKPGTAFPQNFVL